MTTLSSILGASLDHKCCNWTRGALEKHVPNSIFFPVSRGQRADTAKCCDMLSDSTLMLGVLPASDNACCQKDAVLPFVPTPPSHNYPAQVQA